MDWRCSVRRPDRPKDITFYPCAAYRTLRLRLLVFPDPSPFSPLPPLPLSATPRRASASFESFNHKPLRLYKDYRMYRDNRIKSAAPRPSHVSSRHRPAVSPSIRLPARNDAWSQAGRTRVHVVGAAAATGASLAGRAYPRFFLFVSFLSLSVVNASLDKKCIDSLGHR
jgi:hypothetical protein